MKLWVNFSHYFTMMWLEENTITLWKRYISSCNSSILWLQYALLGFGRLSIIFPRSSCQLSSVIFSLWNFMRWMNEWVCIIGEIALFTSCVFSLILPCSCGNTSPWNISEHHQPDGIKRLGLSGLEIWKSDSYSHHKVNLNHSALWCSIQWFCIVPEWCAVAVYQLWFIFPFNFIKENSAPKNKEQNQM